LGEVRPARDDEKGRIAALILGMNERRLFANPHRKAAVLPSPSAAVRMRLAKVDKWPFAVRPDLGAVYGAADERTPAVGSNPSRPFAY
jgi:hypothetical protein